MENFLFLFCCAQKVRQKKPGQTVFDPAFALLFVKEFNPA